VKRNKYYFKIGQQEKTKSVESAAKDGPRNRINKTVRGRRKNQTPKQQQQH